MPKRQQPIFTSDQRQRLLNLKLIEAQITQLEKAALPVARAVLGTPAPMQDVRDELRSLHNAMNKACKAMSCLLNARIDNRARFEALQRVTMADFENGGEGGTMVSANNLMAAAIANVLTSEHCLPKSQRRNSSASILPIQLIDNALDAGFVKGQTKGKAFPPYTLQRSSSPGSPYREIVGICYEAMAQDNIDPERAIKSFIAWRREKDETGRATLGIPSTVQKRRGRPHRIGRQGVKKS